MKFENNNKEIIKRITNRSLKTNKVRNIFTVLAIVLTTFMISSVFSMGLSFIKNYETMNLRAQGTTASISLSNPTENQINQIKTLDIFKSIGYEINVGKVELPSLTNNKTKIAIKYSDSENFQKQINPCVSHIEGEYPREANQIMASEKALEFLGKSNAKIGDKIEVPCNINGQISNKEFILSGYYRTYGIVQDTGYLMVSQKFAEKSNLTLEKNGLLFMDVKSSKKKIVPEILESGVKLNKDQKFNYAYDVSQDITESALIALGVILTIVSFIVLSGYLLIYNVIYIGVTKDINFYGLLKTLGASPKQIKKIVKGQVLRLSLPGILLGLILGGVVSFVAVPLAMSTFSLGSMGAEMPLDVSFNPLIFIGAALFSLLTVILSCKKPAKIAGSISPTEAMVYTGSKQKKQRKNRNSTKGGKLYKMAWYNVFREKKRAFVVFLSLFMGIITFLSVNTFLGSLGVDNYINQYISNDFQIINLSNENGELDSEKLDNAFINKIKALEGVKIVDTFNSSELQLELDEDIIMPSLKEGYRKLKRPDAELNEYVNLIKNDPSKLNVPIVGIEDNVIKEYNKDAKNKINLDDFKSGKIALVDAWYYGENYKNINGDLTIKNLKENKEETFNIKVVENNNQILSAGLWKPIGIPEIFMSTSVIEKLNSNVMNFKININVDKQYEEKIEQELKKYSADRGLLLESKSDVKENFISSQIVMNILGGGIATILILIGILNFINVMITGINVRLKELAIMESIGMTKKQIKKMITLEGVYYASITTGLILTLGMGIVYAISHFTKKIADYAEFVFPAVPLVILIVMIFTVCTLTPSIVFKISSKKSVTERIREIEK